ncbi:hypothetical protein L873DRAFT_1194454 [Choiromyces venosus 120613-1]|uniref:Uncharacterized protein n=1 Tax=Choiromyces venosus 120613-1 TaxID=1336337 RepID=A0A3N4JES4_9PEZI|nr:hypothetical protein L873DRAFT_1194454 [Choiromyces venosus 120613-1]
MYPMPWLKLCDFFFLVISLNYITSGSGCFLLRTTNFSTLANNTKQVRRKKFIPYLSKSALRRSCHNPLDALAIFYNKLPFETSSKSSILQDPPHKPNKLTPHQANPSVARIKEPAEMQFLDLSNEILPKITGHRNLKDQGYTKPM